MPEQQIRTAVVPRLARATLAAVAVVSSLLGIGILTLAGALPAAAAQVVTNCGPVAAATASGSETASNGESSTVGAFLLSLEVVSGSSSVTVVTGQTWPPSVAQVAITWENSSSSPGTENQKALTARHAVGMSTACSIPGLTNGRKYTLRFQAFASDGSPLGYHTTIAYPTPSPQAPSRRSITVTQTGSNAATVSWAASAPYVDVRATSGGKTFYSTPCDANATQCTIPALTADRKYTFVVQLANSSPLPLRGAECPSTVCVQTSKVVYLHSRFWSPQAVTKDSDSLAFLLLAIGLLAGALGGYFLAPRRPLTSSAHSRSAGGAVVPMSNAGSPVPVMGEANIPPPAAPISQQPPVIVRNGSGPTIPVHVVSQDRAFPAGVGVVVTAADPVGFAVFSDGIARRIEAVDGSAIPPGSRVEDTRPAAPLRGGRRR